PAARCWKTSLWSPAGSRRSPPALTPPCPVRNSDWLLLGPCSWLDPAWAVVLGVDLLQDEDRAVRGAAARFAVGALDLPGEVTLHSDRALLRLLRLLTDEFWSYEETLTALLLRLPPCDLYAALCTLQDRSCGLYEQDEPNAFADHLFISSLLLPLLGALLDSMCYSALLCPAVLQWVARTATLLREQIQRCQHWGREQG
ncbi:hypothetical protein FKM82_030290, partial [Ascaphus truei]